MAARRATVAVAVALLLAGCTPDGSTATVERVIDGDTLVTTSGERVRLLGIDAPEKGDCGAKEATAALEQLVDGRGVQLVADPISDTTDRYGRTLAYIEHDGLDVGLELVRDGWAAAWAPASAVPPVRQAAYLVAQEDAQRALRGSWGVCGTIGR